MKNKKSGYLNTAPALKIYILIAGLIFFLRIILFVSAHGNLEHDSGWYLGVAKNLAARGIYASFTNTAPSEAVVSYPSLHGRFSVQDEQGFVYFPAGVTVGPGYIFPEALILKIFGSGWWQYRLWPLLGFFGLIILLFSFAYQLGGFWTLLIFQAWLWSLPSLYFQFAYEAYGEPIAFFFLLGSFCFFLPYNFASKYCPRQFFSGFLFSFSILTKNLFLLAGIPFLIFPLIAFFRYPTRRRQIFRQLLVFISGCLTPLFFFELYRYFFLVGKFGLSAWQAVNQDFWLHFRQNGSGLSPVDFDWKFFFQKASLWLELGFNSALAFWAIYFASPLIFLFRQKQKHFGLFTLIYLSSLCLFVWYLFCSSFGWTRHIWPSLILSMLIISAIITKIISRLKLFSFRLFFILLLLVIISPNFSRLEFSFLLPQNIFSRWDNQRVERGVQGFPASAFFPLSDQQQLITYFSKHIPKNARVYYLGWFLVAEMSPLVDRVFYPLDRYLNYDQHDFVDRKAYLIFGPYQLTKHTFVSSDYFRQKSETLCSELVFSNPSYALCKLKTNLQYQNRAYQ